VDRHKGVYPDLKPSDFEITFDGPQSIGRVYRCEHGSDRGCWFWSMTVVHPGPPFRERSGIETRRGEAARRVVETYERLLARSRDEPASR
jgi:hypothetical protein